MQPEFDSMMLRSEKLTALLHGFEEYVNQVIASNHAMKPEEAVKIVTENFRRSIAANVLYHTEMMVTNEKEGDASMADYNKVMAEVYKSFLK